MHFIFLIVREQSCASALKNVVLCKIVCLFDLELGLNSIFFCLIVFQIWNPSYYYEVGRESTLIFDCADVLPNCILWGHRENLNFYLPAISSKFSILVFSSGRLQPFQQLNKTSGAYCLENLSKGAHYVSIFFMIFK